MKVLESNFSLKFKNNSCNFNNVVEAVKPFVVSELLADNKNIIIVLDDNKKLYLYEDILKVLIPSINIKLLPSWDCFPYSEISPSSRNINIRFKVLTESVFKNNSSNIIITNFKNLVMCLPQKEEIKENLFHLVRGKTYNIEHIINDISTKGYNHVNLVLEPNEYAVRGGIIDIWPVGNKEPYRLDFFGEKLESIKLFDPISQISADKKDNIIIHQSIEPPLSESSKSDFIANYRNKFGPTSNKQLLIHQIKKLNKVDGIEHWMPLFYKKKFISFFDFFQPDFLILNDNISSKMDDFIEDIKNSYLEKKEASSIDYENINQPIEPNLLYLEKNNLYSKLKNVKKIIFNNFSSSEQVYYDLQSSENFETQKKISSDKELYQTIEKILSKANKKKIIFIADNIKNRDKLLFYFNEIFKNSEFITRTSKKQFKDCFDNLSIIDFILLPIEVGFESKYLKVVSFHELFQISSILATKKYKNNINISNLNFEDFIVHNDHGIGKYLGLKTIKIDNLPHDCLVIEYLNNSKLYLPVENINLISKYGDADKNVTLDKLGQNKWASKKNNVKNKIRDLASSLIAQAAKRDMVVSNKMLIDANKLSSFNRGFQFNETQDQISCLEEVYKDLKVSKPMDRLICGDVGFGKTEIALRASYIVSSNGFKIVIIVPTTLLANQHYKTFKQRFKGHTHVELITRNTNAKKKENILRNFSSYKCNILVGTHALLSVNFKNINLGLIVVDEEQHFGVMQKEKIKSLKDNINLLTLSATPIPRTLHMSLLGIRDLSLITTPPVNRQNIRTTVCKFELSIIRKVIQNEKVRSGQIFLIVPRIRDIEKIIKRLKIIYPNLSYEVVHGKLKAKEIEDAMNKFYSGNCDLLLSTSIIESGLDIPKANTLIVYKSDHFGLAQLHQLRGRIGRSKEKGFAYFTIEKNKITKNAERRLKALQAMDTLGAGINLANYDLDIRGAGNLLGEEQSGQIIQVGVELYQKLLQECIDDLNQVKKDDINETIINVKLPVLIPELYISDLSLRLSTYRRLGDLRMYNEFHAFEEEMKDRFGPVPYEFKNLIEIVKLKSLAAKSKIIRIDASTESILIFFNKDFNNYTPEFIEWVTKSSDNIKLLDSHKIKIMNNKIVDNENLLLQVYEIINTIKNILNIEEY